MATTLLDLLTRAKKNGIPEQFVLKVIDVQNVNDNTFTDVEEMYKSINDKYVSKESSEKETIDKAIKEFADKNSKDNAGKATSVGQVSPAVKNYLSGIK